MRAVACAAASPRQALCLQTAYHPDATLYECDTSTAECLASQLAFVAAAAAGVPALPWKPRWCECIVSVSLHPGGLRREHIC